jgi:hypothetical protein
MVKNSYIYIQVVVHRGIYGDGLKNETHYKSYTYKYQDKP